MTFSRKLIILSRHAYDELEANIRKLKRNTSRTGYNVYFTYNSRVHGLHVGTNVIGKKLYIAVNEITIVHAIILFAVK